MELTHDPHACLWHTVARPCFGMCNALSHPHFGTHTTCDALVSQEQESGRCVLTQPCYGMAPSQVSANVSPASPSATEVKSVRGVVKAQ